MIILKLEKDVALTDLFYCQTCPHYSWIHEVFLYHLSFKRFHILFSIYCYMCWQYLLSKELYMSITSTTNSMCYSLKKSRYFKSIYLYLQFGGLINAWMDDMHITSKYALYIYMVKFHNLDKNAVLYSVSNSFF